ncbi:hypothetical protein CQP30_00185 [Yersinia pestis]|uniref:Uncharacterized protein n=5 Tax=Yersinia pseudotuberculosis complex TaxID=1649845 RepID=A0A0H2W5P2_YERPE|nr:MULTISPECIES: hypothetical protein [Yersinia pseudotuberculosis complex]ABG18408.1 hypothetical protein YPN_2079 [Yersinia pestis Nepal516]ADV98256.1 hypothetical protein YPC_1642 [Yersinia pestis biovar Medievalis str. Harbin 35]EDM42094.1 hypothetical protein YPE_0775 [Yersinia pestis CA88-4125]EEO80197.1 hypothetical protein YPF_3013 [Yersinia pestis biovar Orientalis str. India 195]EEO84430.1 hypothetical protein YPH_0243 [Yersinia pestis biovar Orientalis str. PEXU2]EEO89728.1 hypothe
MLKGWLCWSRLLVFVLVFDLPDHMTSDGHDNRAEKPSNIKVADDKFLKNNGVDAH